ncbi:MAG: ABC transporter substrate-binding protein [Eubacteriales bacterium]|nr:ABC transporter substrate-binding protein [Eubacteriales bacterium]
MKKKFLAAMMCAMLAMGTLAGCGQSTSSGESASAEGGTQEQSSDMVTLNLYIPTLATYSEDAITEVENAINEYTADTYGWQIHLNYNEIGTHEQKINLAMTTDQLDVTCYFTGNGQLASYVHNGQLLDITDYYNNASDELKNTFTDAEITASSMDGRLYGLVRKYQYGGLEVVVMNKEIVEAMDIDPASIDSMDKLGEVLYQVHEAYPDIYALVPQSSADMSWAKTWIEGIGLTNFAYTNDVDSTEVGSLFEMESFREFCSYTNRWYQDGLLMSDAVSNTQEGTDMVTAGAAFACLHNADIDPLENIYPNTVTSAVLIESKAIPTDIGNLQYGISVNSAHPDESFELLSALYTDVQLQTLLAYGIEGEHYIINEDGKADYPEGMTAENEPYGGFVATAVYPNYLLLPVKESATVEDYKATIDEWNASVKVSPATGFYFDTAEYTDFVTAYKNLEDKYKNALLTGSIALDDVLPQIQSELTAIGFYEVIEEVQTSLDEYLAQ